MTVDGMEGTPDHVVALVWRVAQEAIRNAVRHSGASTVRVEVLGEGRQVSLTVTDDGAGFDPGRGGSARLLRPARVAEPRAGRRWDPAGGVGARRRDDGENGGGPGMTDEMIRVVIVDDHAVLRAGLEQLLGGEPDLEVVGKASSGEEAIDLVRALRPDVVLMDLQMPGVDGVSATRTIVGEKLADVLVLTSYSDAERIIGALDAGAMGYLLKDAEPDEVLRGIRAVARGESPINPRAARELLGATAYDGGLRRGPDPARERGAGPGAAGARQQADRAPSGHLRAHGQGAPDLGLPADRGRGPDPGRALGRAQRARRLRSRRVSKPIDADPVRER